MGSRLVAAGAALAAMFAAPHSAFAAAGDLDTTFANAGRIALPGYSFGSDLALQTDGKTVATQYLDLKVARFGTNGFLDTTFGTGGISDTAVVGANSTALAIQPDGYIVIAGHIFVTGSDANFAVTRVDTNGHVDPSFGTGGIVTTSITSAFDTVTSVALQPDGKIVVAGVANSPANAMFALVRYDSAGALDPSFGTGGIVTTDYGANFDEIEDIAIQPDGAVVAVGLSYHDFYLDMIVLRYEDDGDLDPTFGTGGIAQAGYGSNSSEGFGVALQPDGKILASGDGSYYFTLARFDGSGALDPTFGDGGSRIYYGVGSVGYAYDLALQPNGSIVLGGARGSVGERDFALARVFANGDFDPTFGDHGIAALDINHGDNYGQAIVLQGDSKIVIAGTAELATNDYRLALARYLAVGPCDSGPAPDGDGDFLCDAADPCLNVSGARDFVADPAATLEFKFDNDKPDKDQLKLRAAFTSPAGGFGSFDPITHGARVLIRRSDTSTMTDAVLPSGAFAGAGTAGWKLNGGGNRWKFIDRSGSPVAGISRIDVRDLSKKSPDRVSVQVIGKHSTYDAYPVAYPLRVTVVLGDSNASAAGLCGEGDIAQ